MQVDAANPKKPPLSLPPPQKKTPKTKKNRTNQPKKKNQPTFLFLFSAARPARVMRYHFRDPVLIPESGKDFKQQVKGKKKEKMERKSNNRNVCQYKRGFRNLSFFCHVLHWSR